MAADCRIWIETAVLVNPCHTTGFHRGSYSRDHSFDASPSPTMCPVFESMVSFRPTCCEIVPRWHSVTVAIDYDAAVGAEDGRTTRPLVEIESVAALPLPDDALSAVKDEGRFLCVGELPVVSVVKASTGRDNACRVVDAEQPPGDVDLVRSVVADLAGSPVGEPVPVVVDDVVAVRRARRGTLPQLVVEIRWHRYHFALSDARSRIGVPGTREVGSPDPAPPNELQDLDEVRT